MTRVQTNCQSTSANQTKWLQNIWEKQIILHSAGTNVKSLLTHGKTPQIANLPPNELLTALPLYKKQGSNPHNSEILGFLSINYDRKEDKLIQKCMLQFEDFLNY